MLYMYKVHMSSDELPPANFEQTNLADFSRDVPLAPQL